MIHYDDDNNNNDHIDGNGVWRYLQQWVLTKKSISINNDTIIVIIIIIIIDTQIANTLLSSISLHVP